MKQGNPQSGTGCIPKHHTNHTVDLRLCGEARLHNTTLQYCDALYLMVAVIVGV